MKNVQKVLIAIFLPCVMAAQPQQNSVEENPQLPPEASESWYEKAVNNIAADWQAEGNRKDAAFGFSVASAGDVNADGYNDVIVGAPFYPAKERYLGAAFVFLGSASGLSTVANWRVLGSAAGVQMGHSVSGAGDVNGDGFDDIIVGSPGYDNGQIGEGLALVFHGSASGIGATAAWQTEGNNYSTFFGGSVAAAGDINGDGFSDVIVGAPGYDLEPTYEGGAAFVYYGSVLGLSTVATRLLGVNQDLAGFGYAVAGAGDVNGDGYSDIIVSSPWLKIEQDDEGAVFVYHGSVSGIDTTAVWQAEGNQVNGRMGVSLSSAGDVNSDGYSDIIVSKDWYNNGQIREGAAFIYHGATTGLDSTAATIIEGNQTRLYLGGSVAGAGDVNNDGFSDVILGTHVYSNGELNEGAVFMYHGSASGVSTTAAWQAESNMADAWFGIPAASAGDVNGDGFSDVIVGARFFENGTREEGAAFVFQGSLTGLSTTENEIFNDFNHPIAYALNGNLMLKMNDLSGEDVQISVLDMAGRLLQTTMQTNVELEISIPFEANAGVYVVQIENKKTGKLYSQKLVW